MSSVRDYDVNSRAFSVAGYELRRSTPCKTSPPVEARVLIASGEWWIKVSWALHSHRNCIKGSSVLFIFVRCRWSRDLRNTCEKGREWHLRAQRARLSWKWDQLFPSLLVRFFLHFFRWDVELWKVWLSVLLELCLCGRYIRGSPWMHEWVFDWNCRFPSQVLEANARSHRKKQKFTGQSTRAIISISWIFRKIGVLWLFVCCCLFYRRVCDV